MRRNIISVRVTPDLWPKIKSFLMTKPKSCNLAVEFRHKDWFQGGKLLDYVINDLYYLNCYTVITDTIGKRDTLHTSLSGAKVCIRFLGCPSKKIDKERLDEWHSTLKDWSRLDEIYFFIHHGDHSLIPPMAQYFQKIMDNKKENLH